MHLGVLSHDRLAFDPLKPVILRGPPTEDASSVFTGNVVLSLAKSTKIARITVTFHATATTYWPEGIGARGTRLTHEKTLSEETIQVFQAENQEKGYEHLSAGIHRFAFAFIVPNSMVETIENAYGRVRHVAEARVVSPSGISRSNTWHISKSVLVLRTYMSNALLTNNSLEDLSRTFEKHTHAADVQIVVEAAAFSSGDLFHVRCIMQPTMKRVRMEHMELFIAETRRLSAPEARAFRMDKEEFPLTFLSSQKLVDGEVVDPEYDHDLYPLFSSKRNTRGMELDNTAAYRLTFATPTCKRSIHHTTYYKDILFRHHLHVNLTLSYPDASSFTSPPMSRNNSSSSLASMNDATATSSSSRPPTPNGASHGGNWLAKLRKSRAEREADGDHAGRKRDHVKLELPITVFDCRLKEDYGRLPSYFELSATKLTHPDPKKATTAEQGHRVGGDNSQDRPKADPCTMEPQVYLCPCYFAFCRKMDLASRALLTSDSLAVQPIERIPSKPPPDYEDS